MFVEKFKLFGMIFYNGCNGSDSKHINNINQNPSQRNKPELDLPASACKKQDNGKNKGLFQTRTSPHNPYAVVIFVADNII